MDEQGIDTLYSVTTKYGFMNLGRCGLCGGGLYKYQRGNLMIYAKPKNHIFRIRVDGSYVTPWIEIKNLDETIQKVIAEETQGA